MGTVGLILLGLAAGGGAGLLAGLIGIGGGIVIVPVIYYGLLDTGVSINTAAHVAVATSLAAIVPTAIVSFLGHWRAGNNDISFLRDLGTCDSGWCNRSATRRTSCARQPNERNFRNALPGIRGSFCCAPSLSAGFRPAAWWLISPCRGDRNRSYIRFCRGRRRHSYQYRYDPFGVADA
jgi:Sulfite exporter TauE/SafE